MSMQDTVADMLTRADRSARVMNPKPVFKIGGAGLISGSAGSIPVRSRSRAYAGPSCVRPAARRRMPSSMSTSGSQCRVAIKSGTVRVERCCCP